MAKRGKRPSTAAEAARWAIDRKREARPDGLKPIEIVKAALCAYQSFQGETENDAGEDAEGQPELETRPAIESEDRAAFRTGRESALDRVLFNVNYWRAAYENRIVAACPDAEDAGLLLKSISAWNSHTMRLNRLSPDETRAMFERFCPPFAQNMRRGGTGRRGSGKGPVPDFVKAAHEVASRSDAEVARVLGQITADVQSEAEVYEAMGGGSALDAFYDLLPVWCLQDRIELVSGSWWDDADVMDAIARALHQRFLELGYPAAICGYYLDSFREAQDMYSHYIATSWDEWRDRSLAELLDIVRSTRSSRQSEASDFEVDGYGDELPAWLLSKEQLIWNTIVCAIYGPEHVRPFLPETAMAMIEESPERLDVITDMARSAYGDYVVTLQTQGETAEYQSFEDQPPDLRDSMLAQIESFHDKLAILGYHIVPAASCYPEQRIEKFTPSEVECLAVLEHRRWLGEREAAGWTYAKRKDVEARQTPYLVPWEELPERAREYNRRAVRNMPALLASVKLAISR